MKFWKSFFFVSLLKQKFGKKPFNLKQKPMRFKIVFGILIIGLFSCNQSSDKKSELKDSVIVDFKANLELFPLLQLPYSVSTPGGDKPISDKYFITQALLADIPGESEEMKKIQNEIENNDRLYFACGKIPGYENFTPVIYRDFWQSASEFKHSWVLAVFDSQNKLIAKKELSETSLIFDKTSNKKINTNFILTIDGDHNIISEMSQMNIKDSQKKIQFTIDTEGKITQTQLPATPKEILSQYFTGDNLKYVLKTIDFLNNIKTPSEIECIVTKDSRRLNEMFNEMIYKIEPGADDPEKWKFLEKIVPGLRIQSAAEGSGVEAEYNFYYLYEKSKLTPEKNDDDFFIAYTNGLAETSYKEQNNIYAYSYSTCIDMETCYTMLGSGEYFKYFENIDKALKVNTVFDEWLYTLQKDMAYNCDWGYYYGTKAEVLAELKKITTTFDFKQDIKEELEKSRLKIESLSDDAFNYKNK